MSIVRLLGLPLILTNKKQVEGAIAQGTLMVFGPYNASLALMPGEKSGEENHRGL